MIPLEHIKGLRQAAYVGKVIEGLDRLRQERPSFHFTYVLGLGCPEAPDDPILEISVPFARRDRSGTPMPAQFNVLFQHGAATSAGPSFEATMPLDSLEDTADFVVRNLVSSMAKISRAGQGHLLP